MDSYSFGPFRLDAKGGILLHGSDPLPIGRRGVALLRALLDRPGTLVAKDILIEAGWPGLAVADANLTVQVAALRRVLGDSPGGAYWIETLPRRGYRYVGPTVTKYSSSDTVNSSAVAELPSLPDKPSLAVLPFQNMSGETHQEYFADGVVEDIITGLSRIRWLFVIGRNTTFTYKGRAIDIRSVGRELGVRYVLEGSVRKAADRVRVTTQLLDAATGAHVWAERYDRQSEDVFALQDEITLSVVGAIEPRLRLAEVDRVKRKRPADLGAYDLVLQAQSDVYSRMPQKSATALVLLERALAVDPTYALAHAYAAECHHSLYLRDGLHEENRIASLRHAENAVTHGQDDAVALSLAAFVFGMEGHDRAAALELFNSALAVSPSLALAYILGSVVLAWGGDAERAINWSERGLRLSPLDPWRSSAHFSSALGSFHLGSYDRAASAARKAVQSNPTFSLSYMVLAAPLVKLGRMSEAKAAAVRVMRLQPTFRYGKQFAGVNCAPALAESIGEALRTAGLPE